VSTEYAPPPRGRGETVCQDRRRQGESLATVKAVPAEPTNTSSAAGSTLLSAALPPCDPGFLSLTTIRAKRQLWYGDLRVRHLVPADFVILEATGSVERLYQDLLRANGQHFLSVQDCENYMIRGGQFSPIHVGDFALNFFVQNKMGVALNGDRAEEAAYSYSPHAHASMWQCLALPAL
jgi:hypothetical protein